MCRSVGGGQTQRVTGSGKEVSSVNHRGCVISLSKPASKPGGCRKPRNHADDKRTAFAHY